MDSRGELAVNAKGSFQLDCIGCKHPVHFSLLDLEAVQKLVCCPACGKKYGFGDETLKRQLSKFASLCTQIKESEEILGNASVAIDVGPHNVKVPLKLFLTRLGYTLDLTMQGQKVLVAFRMEPIST